MTTTSSPEVTLTLRRGTEQREVPLVALAAATHTPIEQMRHACAYLLDALQHPLHDTDEPRRERGTLGGEGTLHVHVQTSTVEIYKTRNVERSACAHEEAPSLLERVIHDLDDERSRPYLTKLVASHAAELIEQALYETLTAPAEKIQTRRAAYFVGVLRRLAERASRERHDPYA